MQSIAPATFANLLTRRQLFSRVGGGFAGLALSSLFGELRADGQIPHDLLPRSPHHTPKATAVIQLFMHGGPSQMDLWDPKPALDKYDGQKPPREIEIPSLSVSQAGGLLRSPFKFQKHGRSGVDVSEVMPHIAEMVDELAVIRSMHTGHNNHEQALWMMHTGLLTSGRPNIGSWVTYALGSENHNLPAYVVLCDPGGVPVDGVRNWSSGWMPPLFQGTPLRTQGSPILNLQPAQPVADAVRSGQLELLARLNGDHQQRHPDLADLEARINAYELAARLQLSATEALDLGKENAATRKLYGLDNPATASYGTRCLLARRLVERGVRFVQIFMRGQPWDTHGKNAETLRQICGQTDLPVTGLLKDLKQRGLLDSTLVFWGGEFGRLPIAQSRDGRDHNRHAFTLWLAGGGVRGGVVHGSTDELGYAAAENKVSVPDLHATMLHLLGLDHRRLTFRHNARDERLTDVHEARIVDEILA
jgi:uncharacterized protein (DUF1501 family)